MKNIKLNSDILEHLNTNFYQLTNASPLIKPKLVSVNENLAYEIGLNDEQLNSKEFVEFINGSFVANGSKPYASAYSGHQFGYQVPNLGDGRALNLGILNDYHLQLKGSGTTAYSRDGDGRAVLRSSIREYLMSEAMYALGIPTSRALAIISSDTSVYRNYEVEKGSIVLRASKSWIRFGSFEFAFMGKDKEKNLKQLADILIDESYPTLKNIDNKYDELYFAIVDKTCELMALWQSVGFMHGVMNTDNMSCAGLTIDYGPYAFMEKFDKSFICNLSDHEGRYSFENQPFIAQWNLLILAKVLSPIINHELCENYANEFIGKFKQKYFDIMGKKLGFEKNLDSDTKIILDLFQAMGEDNIDYTSLFYSLSRGEFDGFVGDNINNWLITYQNRLELEDRLNVQRLESMKKINPKYILRNYMLQEAIDKAENEDYTLVNDLLNIAQNPYDEHKDFEHYTKVNEDFKFLRCSCSS